MSSGRGFRRVARKRYQAVAFGGRGIVSFSTKGVPAVTQHVCPSRISLSAVFSDFGGWWESKRKGDVWRRSDRFMRHRRECC